MTSRTARVSVWGAMVWFATSYAVAMIGYLVVNAAASRLLGRTDFGYFVIALTATTLIGQIGLLGVHRSGLREAARLELTDEEGLRGLRRGVRAVSLITLPLISVLAGASTFVLIRHGALATRVTAALGIAVLTLLSGQQKIWANYLRGFGQVRFATLVEGRSGGPIVSVLQGLFLVLIWKIRPEVGLAGALAAAAVGFAIPVLVARGRVHRLWRHVPIHGRLSVDVMTVLKRDWRFTSNQTASYLNSTVELWLAGLVLTRLDTSEFGAAQRLAMLLVIPLTSLQVVFGPVVSRLLTRDDDHRLEPLLRTGATIVAAASAVVWLPMLVIPGPLLRIVFGPGFSQAAPILVLLTIGNVANVLVGLCGTVLIMNHLEGTVASIQWYGVLARTVLGVVAATEFGAVGMGASAALVTTAVFASMWRVARTRMGLNTHLTLRPDFRLIRSTAG